MQEECDNLENLKNVAHIEEGEGSSTPEGRVLAMKNSNGRIKKLQKEIEKGEFKGPIIDRAKSQHEIDTQIDQLAGEFQKTERSAGISEVARDGDQYSEGLGDVLPGNEKMGHPIPNTSEWEAKGKEELPQKKKIKSKPLRR